MLREFILVLSVISSIKAVAVTKRYVDEILQGIEELQKISREHHFIQEDFDHTKYNEPQAIKDAEEYDFVIVGGGTAGSVLASRLSEIPEWNILLLEAGGEETEVTKIPMNNFLLVNSPYSWGYLTTRQRKWCFAEKNQECLAGGGKLLGGSSSTNGMFYTRGNAQDYDAWADLGNDGWRFSDVLPYFKKIEDAHLIQYDHNYHNYGGPLRLENSQYFTVPKEAILQAAEELHLPIIDQNGKDQLGIGLAHGTTKHGKRYSAAQAYLAPARDRPNLTIKTLSRVIKIIINPHSKETIGALYLHGGKMFVAKASKEVVISAGALNTPQLLLLSGIGPKEDLKQLGIALVANRKVGHNLMDHPGFMGLRYIFDKSELQPQDLKKDLVDYFWKNKGPLTAQPTQIAGFFKTNDSANFLDLELIFVPSTEEAGGKLKQALNIGVLQTHPKSVGTLKLRDKDPLHHPLIDLNLLSDEHDHDLETLLKGVRFAQKFTNANAFHKLGIHLDDRPVPDCENHRFDSDNYWKCAIRQTAISFRHYTGTAKMGLITDPDSVVCNKLRVHEIYKLRVADASVIPVSITGHTMAPAYLIGEHGAHILKEHWKW